MDYHYIIRVTVITSVKSDTKKGVITWIKSMDTVEYQQGNRT